MSDQLYGIYGRCKNFFVHVPELIHCRPENWLEVNSVVSLKRREILHVLLFDFIVIDLTA